MNDLIPKGEGSETHFWYYGPDGRKWSVVDIGKMMSTAPPPYDVEKWRELGMFLGWEAMPVTGEGEDEELDSDAMERADSWESLKALL